ncbi:MAG: hypothetical protein KTR29_16020 [Rhodothermaceae bacterium]|nr:hypothetical protein [Rhodothermaceae bacterium]
MPFNAVSPAPIVPPEKVTREGLITAKQCAEYYVNAIEGKETGQVFRAWGGLENDPILESKP